MRETTRIKGLIADLYNGHPWIEVTVLDTLKEISAEQAAARVGPLNSIWEILNHMISWRRNVLRRIQGETLVTPADNYIVPIEDSSDAAWKRTLAELDQTQAQWLDYLSGMDDSDLEKSYPVNGMSYALHIHGIIQHDAYHLGQIVLLAKTLRSEPPGQ